MGGDSVRAHRVECQMLEPTVSASVDQIVHRLAGVQAQDLRWTSWTVGARSRDCAAGDVADGIENRHIVKSWLFRGTLHLVTRQDLLWMTDLVAPVIVKRNARRYRQLGLDLEDFLEAERLLRGALSQASMLSRSQVRELFEKHGLSADGQRLHYLLQRASLDGVLCHGPEADREATFVLRDAVVAHSLSTQDRSVSIRRLAQRYFAGHGPAGKVDFVWWSGLPAAEVSAAVAELIEERALVTAGPGQLYCVPGENIRVAPDSLNLLGPFDEYLVGYKDRALVLDPAWTKIVNAGGGMIKPTVVYNGMVRGIWSYRDTRAALVISVLPFADTPRLPSSGIDAAVSRLSQFLGQTVRVEDSR
jgi:hypothetical protein